MTNLVEIEGIADAYAAKLHDVGIATVEALLSGIDEAKALPRAVTY